MEASLFVSSSSNLRMIVSSSNLTLDDEVVKKLRVRVVYYDAAFGVPFILAVFLGSADFAYYFGYSAFARDLFMCDMHFDKDVYQ